MAKIFCIVLKIDIISLWIIPKKVKINKAAVHELERTKIYLTKIVNFLPLC